MTTLLNFHHMGMLTGQLDLARIRLIDVGYSPGPVVFDPQQNVALCMCNSAHLPQIELVTPGNDNEALLRLLKRRDDYIYHLCFSTTDMQAGFAALQGDALHRVVEISPPKPAVLFGGSRVAFYSVPGLGLVELLELRKLSNEES